MLTRGPCRPCVRIFDTQCAWRFIARPGDIVRGVVRHSLAMAGAGLVIGAARAVMLARLLEGFVVGVASFDSLTIASWCLVLIVVALIASYLPARRATRIDPAAVLSCRS